MTIISDVCFHNTTQHYKVPVHKFKISDNQKEAEIYISKNVLKGP